MSQFFFIQNDHVDIWIWKTKPADFVVYIKLSKLIVRQCKVNHLTTLHIAKTSGDFLDLGNKSRLNYLSFTSLFNSKRHVFFLFWFFFAIIGQWAAKTKVMWEGSESSLLIITWLKRCFSELLHCKQCEWFY